MIIDTSALSVVAHAALQSLVTKQLQEGIRSADQFITDVQQILDRLTGCAQGHTFLTTTTAYEHEMMSNRPLWVYEGMPYLSSIYEDARVAFGAVLDSRLRRLPIAEDEAQELRRQLRSLGFNSDDLSQVDAGIIMLGLRSVASGNVFVITDELKMHDAIACLRRNGPITIRGAIYNAESLTALMVIEAARCVHACCELDSERYHCCLMGFAKHIDERREQQTISPELARSRRTQFSQLFGFVDAEQKSKAEHNTRARRQASEEDLTGELMQRWGERDPDEH